MNDMPIRPEEAADIPAEEVELELWMRTECSRWIVSSSKSHRVGKLSLTATTIPISQGPTA